MIISSAVVVAVAGQALAINPQVLRHSRVTAPKLPMYEPDNLVQTRGGVGTGFLNDSDVNQGVIGWNFDEKFAFVTADFLETLPDLSPINAGEVFGGTNTFSGGSVLQEATHTYIGFDATNNWHIHSYEFSIRDNSGAGFVPAGTTIGGIPINFISSEMGTNNLLGNGMTFDGEVLGFYSASMDVYVGGALASTEDFFTSFFSGAFLNNEGGHSYNDSFILQGFTPQRGKDISGFNLDKFVMRGALAVAAPSPGTLALFAACGCAGIRRRR